MDVTYALFELRDALLTTGEAQSYTVAKEAVENDVELQILFGEFDRLKEVGVYMDESSKMDLQRAQQVKMRIFANANYKQLQSAEKKLNVLRMEIAKRLFSEIDPNIVVAGDFVAKGGCKCG